jgi:hypothetical protein
MHPRRTGAESRLGWITITGLWANAIYWSIMLIDRARLPQTFDGFRYRHGDAPANWAFPTHDVADWVCAMAIEALVVSALLRRVTGSITGICLAVGALCGLAFLAMAPLGMHAPATFVLHLVSLLFSAGWLIARGSSRPWSCSSCAIAGHRGCTRCLRRRASCPARSRPGESDRGVTGGVTRGATGA